LVQPFEHVGRLHVLVMRQRQSVIGQGLLDVVLDPVAQPRVLGLPFSQPLADVAASRAARDLRLIGKAARLRTTLQNA
jgi:hypothetical protein